MQDHVLSFKHRTTEESLKPYSGKVKSLEDEIQDMKHLIQNVQSEIMLNYSRIQTLVETAISR